jgi:hypothetical protein
MTTPLASAAGRIASTAARTITAGSTGLLEILTRLPAGARQRSEADAIFGASGGDDHFAIPRGEALHLEDETRAAMIADLEADPAAEIERSAVSAARAYELLNPPGKAEVAGALRASLDRLARVAPLAALALAHAACSSLTTHDAPDSGAEFSFDLAVDLGGAPTPASAEAEPDERCELARAIVSPETLGRVLVVNAPPAVGGSAPATAMAGRVRALLGRMGEAYAHAVLDAFPRAGEPLVREEMARYLVRAGDGVVAPVAALVPSVDVEPAIALLRVLVAIGSGASRSAVGSGGRSPHPLVRIEALHHLEGASSERLRAELSRVLEDPEPGVRLEALRVITQNHIMAAGPHLALAARTEAFDSLPVAERREALATLAALLPSRAEDICLEHLEKTALLPRAAHEETRELSAELLGAMASSPEVERALIAVSERKWRNSERIRAAALAAAHRIARRRAGEGPDVRGGAR